MDRTAGGKFKEWTGQGVQVLEKNQTVWEASFQTGQTNIVFVSALPILLLLKCCPIKWGLGQIHSINHHPPPHTPLYSYY
jgi:hypothetical protein